MTLIAYVFDVLYFQIKQTISKLQAVVCAEGRFRVMREALHRCDPPCIPYLGMYLTDLSFIEEGTPDFTPDGLLNFSKMRMVCIGGYLFPMFYLFWAFMQQDFVVVFSAGDRFICACPRAWLEFHPKLCPRMHNLASLARPYGAPILYTCNES